MNVRYLYLEAFLFFLKEKDYIAFQLIIHNIHFVVNFLGQLKMVKLFMEQKNTQKRNWFRWNTKKKSLYDWEIDIYENEDWNLWEEEFLNNEWY